MRITLGVTGGVAAYKAAELVSRLQQENFTVQVVMTRAAREFVTPLTFAALSGQKVITDLFAASDNGEANLESAIEHIAVAQRTDLLLVAPATVRGGRPPLGLPARPGDSLARLERPRAGL